MAISECPSRETHLAADISLIVENHGRTLAELGFRVCAGARPGQTGVAEWKPCLEGLRQDCGGFVDRASGLLSLVSVPGGRIRVGYAQNPS